jgi:signal transduction histidine kinase
MKFSEFSPELRAAFVKEDRRVRIANSKGGCWLAIVLMPAGYSLDAGFYPEKALLFLKLRILCSLLVAGVLALLYTEVGRRFYKFLSQIWYILPLITLCWIIYASNGAVCPHYLGLYIVLLTVGLMLPWTYQENLFAGVLVTVMYVAACWFNQSIDSPMTTDEFKSHLYFLILTDIIVVTGSYFQERIRLSEFVLRFELDKNKRMLEESNRKLVEMDGIKSRFFANISHELRTPLTLLIAPLESMMREKGPLLDEGTRQILKIMQVNAMRLLKLINDLLDLVKLESGRMEVRKEPLAIDEFIKGLVQAIQGPATDKRVSLSTRVEKGPPAVLADRDKLEKIVLNLLFNSVKFTPAGGTVELNVQTEGKVLTLKVRDSGMGIAEKDLSFIFDRFWQGDSSAQRRYQGTGIGLALVKELAEAQGGTVTAESRLGKGTTMTVKIPVEELQQAPQEAEPGPPGPSPAASDEWLTKLYRRAELFPAITPLSDMLKEDSYSRSRRPRILIVDDEPDILRFLKSELDRHYEIIEAVDGVQALEKGAQFLPDLILLDMMMPGKDGIQACREFKEKAITRAIPVILLTARADDETKISALNAGANDFLTKPFSTTELHVRVKNLIEFHQFQMELSRQKSALESALDQVKETEGQLVQNEKMASLGRMSAGIIHEINNPLNYAATALHVLKAKKESLPAGEREKFIEIVTDIEEGVDRVQRIVSDLRSFTHPSRDGVDSILLADVVKMACRFLSHQLKERVRMEVDLPEGQRVLADRNKLIQIFINLLQNSLDAFKGKDFGDEKPAISIRSKEAGGKVLVSVRDNGTGIDPVHLDKIFDPFFTTKDVGEGMGLGLSISYRILREQGGNLSARSEKGKYTEFTLEIPVQG